MSEALGRRVARRSARAVNSTLGRFGFRLTRWPDPWRLDLMWRVHTMAQAKLVDVPETERRVEHLSSLMGTDAFEGLYLIENLHRALAVTAGDVCEFGVAQGLTSALIANELLRHAPERTLWLYDSFEGLPRPSAQDRLVSDIFELGSIEAYAGQMSSPRQMVEAGLRKVGWSRTRIVSGFVDRNLTQLPERVAFAYLDFDFYQPTWDVLQLLKARVGVGGIVMVDDYGHFSSGVQEAVDKFCSEEGWSFEGSPAWAGPFAVLRPPAADSRRPEN
jgi:O-methyltransferase